MTIEARGYIALFTVLILTFALTLLAAIAGEAAFFARMNTSDLGYRRAALHLARSCASVGLLRGAQDSDFSVAAPGIDMPVGDTASCHLDSAETRNSVIFVTTTGRVGTATAHVTASGIVSNTGPFRLKSWKEM